MPASELIEHVVDLVTEFRPRYQGAAARDFDDLLLRLRSPVRVAVVGRVKAGKSTLVNALLGQRVAPTDVSECTKIVTWFHYGQPQRVELLLTDGTRVPRQLDPDGRLPAEIGVPLERVTAIHAYLANDALKDLTLIDTPGIASVNEKISASTEQLLAAGGTGRETTEQTDAVVFLMNQVLMAEEMEALGVIGAGTENAASTVGVLSKADKLGDGEEDPWPVAVALASRYSGQFKEHVSTVVPVVGLIAETAETAALTETDARAISSLSRMEAAKFERLLWSPDRFVSGDSETPPESRERLLGLLDLYGVRHAVQFSRDGSTGAVAMRRQLSSLSGIAEVKRVLLAYFSDKDHILKVRSALAVAERISYQDRDALDPAAGADLRSRLEALRLDPLMHPLNELDVWQDLRSGKINLPGEMQAEIERLAGPGTPAARAGVPEGEPKRVVDTARDAMVRWRTFMNTEADPGQARIARVAIRSYQLIWTAASAAVSAN